jgi:hypothetical protein
MCGTQEVLGLYIAVYKGTEMYTASGFNLLVSGDSCIRVDFHFMTCDV